MSEPTAGMRPRGSLMPRLYWILLGPAVLVVMASLIAKHPTWSLGWRDVLFWGALGGIVAMRWLDVRFFGGQTADGTPATFGHVQRHALLVGVVGIVVWAAAHSVDV